MVSKETFVSVFRVEECCFFHLIPPKSWHPFI